MKLFKKIFRREFIKTNKLFLLILCLWTIWVAYWSWVLPYNMGPDECLHFKTAQFFQINRRLPVAGREEITFIRGDDCFGTTYLSTPFLNYIITAFFIQGGDWNGIERDYLAGRVSSVFFGVIFVFFLYGFLKRFFKNERLLVFSTLISIIFIPQVTYIFSYLNQESYSLAITSLLLFTSYYFYLLPQKQLGKMRNYLFLGSAMALQLLTKSNFYLVLLIPALVLLLKLWPLKKAYLKNLFGLMAAILMISGWFFARNYFLYRDFLGVRTYQLITRSYLGTRTYFQAGWNLYDIFLKSSWLEETASSFYGRFGYMTIAIDPVMQWLFRFFVFLGIVGLVKKASEKRNFVFWFKNNILYFSFLVLIPLNIGISLWNSLYFDFQNQGRYLFPILVPLMVLVNKGVFGLSENKDSRKTLAIGIVIGSILLNFWSFLYLPKI